MINIEYKKTETLIPYVNNARTHSDEQVMQIASSIKEFGFTNPVLIDGDNGIIAGHGRIMAANKLGLEEVPTIELSHLSAAQRKAYILADNQLALNSGWDMDLLKIEIDDLSDMDFDIDLLGFDADFISDLNGEYETNDYSDKNKELDLDDFDDNMQMKFDLSKEQFDFISERLSNINESKEIALLQVLNYES